MNISIVGSGYLGLTTASIMANAGHKVYCLDIKQEVIDTILKGYAHFFEPYLDPLVKEGIKTGLLIPTLDYSKAIPDSDISFICVNTPSDDEGNLSLDSANSSASQIAKYLKPNHTVVMKSTVPVGTSSQIISLMNNITKNTFGYVSNPEFLAEGQSVLDTMLPDRIVIGTDDNRHFKKVYDVFKQVDDFAKNFEKNKLLKYATIYRKFYDLERDYDKAIIKVSIPSAELIKVTANSFLSTKISFANAIAVVCDKTGADINEVMKGIGSDPRIGYDFLYAGLGWGGGCFPKDTLGLVTNAKKFGYDFKLLKEVRNVNDKQIGIVIEKIEAHFKSHLTSKTVSILGLSFKPGTNDTRYSPSIALVEKLSKYVQQINVYDPQAMENAKYDLRDVKNVIFFNTAHESLANSDMFILATEWPEFLELDFEQIKSQLNEPTILDARNRLDKEFLEKLGYKYIGIGR